MTTDLAGQPSALPLLATKLHRPRISAPLVQRPRLLEELNTGLRHRLTLISAPAGYGKTTAVNQWLDVIDLPSAWISLDEHDSNLATFLTYLLAAVRSVYPDAGRSSEPLLRAPNFPSPDRLADAMLHDLVALPGSLILVLDDYHSIQSLDVHMAMARLVQHLPAHVQLVITTRADPPLSLERLRGRQQITELRSADLRFTLEEASQPRWCRRCVWWALLSTRANGEAGGGAFILFLTNFLAILLAGGITVMVGGLGQLAIINEHRRTRHNAFILIVVATLLVAMPLSVATYQAVDNALETQAARTDVQAWLAGTPHQIVAVTVRNNLVIATTEGSGDLPPLRALADQLAGTRQRPVVVNVRVVPSQSESSGAAP